MASSYCQVIERGDDLLRVSDIPLEDFEFPPAMGRDFLHDVRHESLLEIHFRTWS
jgi:hypothetical protein